MENNFFAEMTNTKCPCCAYISIWVPRKHGVLETHWAPART